MSKITAEAAEEMKRRVIANGGSVGEPPKPSPSRVNQQGVRVGGSTKPKSLKPRMNGTETEFHAMLLTRNYSKVQFEGITIELATGAKYTPDFYCVTGSLGKTMPGHIGNPITFFETKNNFIREAALVRLKVAARQFPEFTFVLAQKKKGVWTETVVQS